MTISQALIAKLGVDMKDYHKGMRKAQRLASESSEQIATAFKRAGVAAAALGIAALALGAKFAKSVIGAADSAEQYRVRLDALLGSTEEGARAFSEMADFASRVPYEYEQIMGAATSLSGVLKGGVDEIKMVMPIITDLATVSGLSIEETTGQIIRSFSAGIGSADLFRERGISAMMGFQQGVSYSAEETRDRIIAAFADSESKFRGASKKMANTWGGLTSMLSDRWFQFKNMVADAGLFDAAKRAIGTVLDKLTEMAESGQLQAIATKVSDTMLTVVRSSAELVIKGVAKIQEIGVEVSLFWEGTLPAAVMRGKSKIQNILANLTSFAEEVAGEQGTLSKVLDWLPPVAVVKAGATLLGEATGNSLSDGLRSRAAVNEQAARDLVATMGTAAAEELAAIQSRMEGRLSLVDMILGGGPGGETPTQAAEAVHRVVGDLQSFDFPVLLGPRDMRVNLEKVNETLDPILQKIQFYKEQSQLSTLATSALATNLSGVVSTSIDRIGNGVADIVTGFKNVADTAKELGATIIREVVGAIAKAIVKALVLKAIMAATGGTGGIFGSLLPFKQGGMIPAAANGMMLPQFAPAGYGGGIPIMAHPGEGVLTREAVGRIGGPSSVHALNRGEASGGTRIENLSLSFPNVRDSADLKRELPAILRDLVRKGRI